MLEGKYKKSMPCKFGKVDGRFGEVYGRVIGHVDDCAWQDDMPSMVYFATPGNTVIKSGILYLDNIEEDNEKLLHFEKLAKDAGGKTYNDYEIPKNDN